MTICVQDVMVRDVITLDAKQNAKNAAIIMTKFGISGVIVQTEKNIVGIFLQEWSPAGKIQRTLLSRIL